MHIKCSLRFHLTPVRKAKIKEMKDNGCWQGCGKGECSCAAVRGKTDGAAVGLSAAAALLFDPTVPLPGIYQKGPASCCRDTCSFVAAVALLSVWNMTAAGMSTK